MRNRDKREAEHVTRVAAPRRQGSQDAKEKNVLASWPSWRLGALTHPILLALLLIALTGCSSQPSSRKQLAFAYAALQQRDYDAAFAQSSEYLARHPDGAGAAEAWIVQGRVHEAKAEQAGAAKRPDDARAQLTAAANAYLRAIGAKPAPAVEGLARSGLANAAFHLDDYTTAVREWGLAFPLVADADAKAWILYRVGVCQQRLGWFDMADRSFTQLRQQYPSADSGQPAARAAQRVGHRAFFVQVGTFDSPANADRVVQTLARQRLPAARDTDPATGRHVVRVGPAATWAEAETFQSQVTATYPDALIVP